MTLVGFRGAVAYECQIGRLVLRVIHLRAAYWAQAAVAPLFDPMDVAMVKCGPDLSVNPAYVSMMTWDRRHYANGAGPSTLVITMADGSVHRVEHTPGYLNGVDAYAVERLILAHFSTRASASDA